MSIITISSESYEQGREIAKKSAAALGYAYLGREILDQVGEKYNIQGSKLTDALDKMNYVFRMPAKLRKRYISYIKEAVLSALLADNVVCQGLLAHLYVLGVSHALKVRIVMEPDVHAQQMSTQSGISVKRAKKQIERNKKLRQQWSQSEFRFDETDPAKYDLMISLSQIDPDEAVNIITETVKSRRFQPMTYSLKCLQDLELAGQVQAKLIEQFPSSRVFANGGNLVIETIGLKREKQKRESTIREIAMNVPGVEYVEVHFINDFFRQAAESLR